jgi:hypothetical protein
VAPTLRILRSHAQLILMLLFFAVLYSIFRFQIFSVEVYSYAAGIEKYYNIATTFALSQGDYLPDFGRYHPNHPLGHAIAGLVFDLFGISALGWLLFINASTALTSAVFIYLLALQENLSKNVSVIAAALFLSTHAAILAAFSGEWHMPALALCLAGTWQITQYLELNARKQLWQGALFFAAAVGYHTAALSLAVCVGVMLLIVRHQKWRDILKAASLGAAIVIVVYFLLPFIILKFTSLTDFLRTFFIYRFLDHTRFVGLDWFIAAIQTILHVFLLVPAKFQNMNWFAIPSLIALVAAVAAYFRATSNLPKKLLLAFITFGWPLAMAIAGSRPNAVFGWLFVLPMLCVAFVKVSSVLLGRWCWLNVTLPVFLLAWNFWFLVLPNFSQKPAETTLFQLPSDIPKSTPIGFVAHELVTSMSEIWHAGSNLNYRKQEVFYPCCGEDAYLLRLRRWLKINPGAILATNGPPENIERLLRSEGLMYRRWLNRQVSWSTSMVPATLYFILDPDFHYEKRLTIWLPEAKVPF